MIDQFCKHLRKWLIGLAMVVRNQAQAVVAKMESVEEEAAEGADRLTAPGAANTARSGEPPAHWVQLVERHAPELLVPGPPDTAPRTSSRVFEADPAGVPSYEDRIQGPASSNTDLDAAKSQTREDPDFSLKLSRLSRRHGAPLDRRPSPLPGVEKPARDTDRPAEAAFDTPEGDAGPQAPAAPPAGSAKVPRAAVSAAGAEKTTRRQSLKRQSTAGPLDPRAPGPATRKTEAPVAWTSPAPRFGSAAGRVAKNRPVKRESQYMRPGTVEDSQPTSRTGKRVESIIRPAQNRQTGLQSAAGTPAPPAIKSNGVYQKGPRPNGSFKARPSLPVSGDQTAAPPIKSNDDDRRHIQEVRLINGQGPGRPPEESEIGGQKRFRPPKFHWPDLPGENRSADDRVSDGDPAWPNLPPAPSAAADSWWPQPHIHSWEAASRASERLRRLDEEQRGISWSASHF